MSAPAGWDVNAWSDVLFARVALDHLVTELRRAEDGEAPNARLLVSIFESIEAVAGHGAAASACAAE